MDLSKPLSKTVRGNTNWLHNAMSVHVDVTTREDGSVQASARNGQFQVVRPDSTTAIRDLKAQLHEAARKGEF